MTVCLSCASDNMKSEVLRRVQSRAHLSGMETVLFLSPVDPQNPEHLYLPERDLFITGDASIPHDRSIELSSRCRKMPDEAKDTVERLIESASRAMLNAKMLHDTLEKHYIPRMDFSKLVECESRVIYAFDLRGK